MKNVLISIGGNCNSNISNHNLDFEQIIAVDSGIKHIFNLSLEPSILVGDMDSISEEDYQKVIETNINIERYQENKNYTDFELGLNKIQNPQAPGLTMDNPNTPSPAMIGNPEDLPELKGEFAEKVKAVLENQINPAIASHGGAAQLIGVEGTDIYLKLGGGCQGCGMAQVTLTQGIEASLRQAVPEIGNIIDATDHAAGDNPYFASH